MWDLIVSVPYLFTFHKMYNNVDKNTILMKKLEL